MEEKVTKNPLNQRYLLWSSVTINTSYSFLSIQLTRFVHDDIILLYNTPLVVKRGMKSMHPLTTEILIQLQASVQFLLLQK
jgi:hypothetical protein